MNSLVSSWADKSCDSPKRMTIRENLELRLKSHKEQIAEIEATIKLLDETPAFEKIHDAISKIGL